MWKITDRVASAMLLPMAILASTAIGRSTTEPPGVVGIAGDTIVIDTTKPCASCRIEVNRVTTLGGAKDSIAVYGFPRLVRSWSQQRFYVNTIPNTRIAVYDRHGRFRRLIGRSGGGPGEFRSVSRFGFGPSDSLVVFDDLARRASVFDASGTFVRSFVLKVATTSASSMQWLDDGSFLVGGTVATEDRIGYPLHHLAPDGSIIRSFGSYPPRADPTYDAVSFRRAVVHADTVWASRLDRYSIDMMTLGGEHIATFVRNAEWFPDRNSSNQKAWGTYLPDPYLVDLTLDNSGYLWVLTVVGREEWVPGKPVEYESGNRREYYRTLIEVLEPRSGRLVAHRFFEDFTDGFAEPGVMYTHRPDSAGDIVYDVWHVSIQG
jgi:hypothetical protein